MIDDEGHIIEQQFPKYNNRKSILIGDKNKAININILQKWFLAQGNSSSMVIRKKILKSNLNELKKICIALDSFIFLVALISRGEILIDEKRLTRYRLHTNGSVTNPPLVSEKEFWLHRSKNTKWLYEDISILYSIGKNTQYKKLSKVMLSEAKIYSSIYNSRSVPNICEYFTFLNAKRSRSSLSLVMQSVAAQLFRKQTIKLIYKHYLNERKNSNE